MARPDWIGSWFALREPGDERGPGTPNAADTQPRGRGSAAFERSRYRVRAGRLLREVSTWSMSPYSRDSSAERILSRSMSVLTCSFVRFE